MIQQVQASVQIINAFVKMRHILFENALIQQSLEKIESKFLETNQKLEKIFKALDGNIITTQGVFFDGQVFDTYELASKSIRSAKTEIILIDNYMDETTLIHLVKKKKPEKVLLLTKNISQQMVSDVQKVNTQNENFEKIFFKKT